MKIALFYGHVASNIGDLAINVGLANALQGSDPELELHVVTLDSDRSQWLKQAEESFRQLDRVKFIHFRSFGGNASRYLLEPDRFFQDLGLEACDTVIVNSGEHLFQYEGLNNDKSFYWRLLPAYAAKACGKRCVIAPSTLGPFQTQRSRDAAFATLRVVDAFALRETASLQHVPNRSDQSAVRTMLDPGFFVPAPAGEATTNSASAEDTTALVMRSEQWGIRVKRKDVAVHHTRAYKFGRALCERLLVPEKRRVRIFIQTEADRALAEAIAASLSGGAAERVELVYPQSVHAYVDELASCNRVIAARFHALVLGLVAGIPAHGIYFDSHAHKMPGLYSMLQAEPFCHDISEGAVEELVDKVYEGLSNEQDNFSRIFVRLAQLREETVRWLRACFASPVKPVNAERLAKHQSALAALAVELTEASFKGREARKIAALQEKLSHAAEAQASLQASISATGGALKRAEEQAETLEQLNHRLRHELNVVRASFAYGLGKVLVGLVREPFSTGDNLRALRRTLRLRRRRDQAGVFERKLEILVNGGDLKGICALIVQQAELDKTSCADELLLHAKTISEAGDDALSYAVAREALKHDNSEKTMRAVFWAAQRSRNYDAVLECINEIERGYGEKVGVSEQLQKIRGSIAYQLTAFKLACFEADAAQGYVPIPNKVCYVLHNSLPYSSGGYATRAEGVMRGLNKAGFDVVVVTRPGFPLDVKPELRSEDVPLKETFNGFDYVRSLEPQRAGTQPVDYLTLSADVLERQFRELRPEYVIAASNHLTGIPALIAARRLGIRFFYEVRGFWEITRVSREPEYASRPMFHLQKFMEAKTAMLADHVFTLNQPMKDELSARGVPEDKITLVPNACDPARFLPVPRDGGLAAHLGIPNRVPVIGYVGSFVAYEGLELLAQACAQLKKRGVGFRLLLVGNEDTSGSGRGPISDAILDIANRGGFQDWLIMPGRVPHDQVEKYYSLIDVAPFPRRPWLVCEMVSPMKPLEAMAMEKAVVVSGVAALRGMVEDNRTGLVFERDSVSDLSAKLEFLLANPAERERLGKQAREFVSSHRTWEINGRVFASILRGRETVDPLAATAS